MIPVLHIQSKPANVVGRIKFRMSYSKGSPGAIDQTSIWQQLPISDEQRKELYHTLKKEQISTKDAQQAGEKGEKKEDLCITGNVRPSPIEKGEELSPFCRLSSDDFELGRDEIPHVKLHHPPSSG